MFVKKGIRFVAVIITITFIMTQCGLGFAGQASNLRAKAAGEENKVVLAVGVSLQADTSSGRAAGAGNGAGLDNRISRLKSAIDDISRQISRQAKYIAEHQGGESALWRIQPPRKLTQRLNGLRQELIRFLKIKIEKGIAIVIEPDEQKRRQIVENLHPFKSKFAYVVDAGNRGDACYRLMNLPAEFQNLPVVFVIDNTITYGTDNPALNSYIKGVPVVDMSSKDPKTISKEAEQAI